MSLDNLLIDVATKPAASKLSSMYVAFSRATRQSGIRIFGNPKTHGWLTFKDEVPKELIGEDRRLARLETATRKKYNKLVIN
jgi:hypothetical protein